MTYRSYRYRYMCKFNMVKEINMSERQEKDTNNLSAKTK